MDDNCENRDEDHHTIPETVGEESMSLRTLGGTPNRDPCSLWGLIWGVPKDIGVIMTIHGLYIVMGLGVPSRGPS